MIAGKICRSNRSAGVRLAERAGGVVAAFAMLSGGAAYAQDSGGRDDTVRWRIGVGPQLKPSYPGSDGLSLRPYIDVARARGTTPFAFEAPDESTGFAIAESDGFAIGPAIGFEGSRTKQEVGADVDKIGLAVELGGFAEYQMAPFVRVRGELRRGVTGHSGWIGQLSADYIARDGDRWVFSIGPRLTITDNQFQRTYFGVTQAEALRTDLSQYRIDGGGVQAVGATTGLYYQFSPRWGAIAYLKYDRLAGNAARSPLVRQYGSRNQFYGGIALSYTFSR